MRRVLTVVCLLGASLITTLGAPASASVPATLAVVGHGWGHGRGMGQYGALGYASAPYNWNYAQILGHYYGGTRLAGASEAPINVALSELAGAGAITVTAQDTYVLSDNDNGTVKTLNVEKPGQVDVSSAEAMLKAL